MPPLAHAVAGGGNIDDGRTGRKGFVKQLCKVERRRNAHRKRVAEFLIGTFVHTAGDGQSVVDEHIHPAMLFQHICGKCLQHALVGNIAHIVAALCLVNDAHMRALLFKLLRHAQPDAVRAAGDNDHFVLKHGKLSFLN